MTPLKNGFLLSTYVLSVSSVHYYPNYDENLRKSIPQIEGKITAFRLPNELDVIIHQSTENDGPSGLSLSVGVGFAGVSCEFPVNDDPVEGLAHLVEHCILNRELFVHDVTASTKSILSEYLITFKELTSELLYRFVQPFINPGFFIESFFQKEIEIINHEWAFNSHRDARAEDRYPQLLMTQGHPAQLFTYGNRDTLMRSDILDKIWSFLGKHYKTKNMKLAVTLSPSVDMSLMEALIIDNFGKIPPYYEVQPPLAPNTNTNIFPPFWSVDHSNELVKVFSKQPRRNKLFLYWYVPCEGAFNNCNSILALMKSALNYKLRSRNYSFSVKIPVPGHYILVISTILRDRELGNVDRIVGDLIAELKSIDWRSLNLNFRIPGSPITAESLSYFMLTSSSIYDALMLSSPEDILDEEKTSLIIEYLESLSKTDPRVVVVMKSSYLRVVDIKTLIPDPYYHHYYTFEPFSPLAEPSESHNIELCTSKFIFSIETPLPFILQFQCGLVLELIVANLQENGIPSTLEIDNEKLVLEISPGTPELMLKTLPLFVSYFQNPESLFYNVDFEKAFYRQIREMKHAYSRQCPYDIAYDYAVLFDCESFTEVPFLTSDPLPVVRSAAFVQYVAKATLKSKEWGAMSVGFDFNICEDDKSVLNPEELTFYLLDEWNGDQPLEEARFVKPRPQQTFIYVPSVVEGSNNSFLITFDTASLDIIYLKLVAGMLRIFLLETVRGQMNLSYHTQAKLLPCNRLSLYLQSAKSPKVLYDAFNTAINELPMYVSTLTTAKLRSIAEMIDLPPHIAADYCGAVDIFNLRQIISNFILPFGPNTSQSVIQIWSQNWAEEREKYLYELEQATPPNTKVFTSIEDYPIE